MKKQRSTTIILAIIFLSIGIFRCFYKGTEAPTRAIVEHSAFETTESTQKQGSLEVIESHNCYSDYMSSICGTVKNNSSRNYSYVQVEVNLYGRDGSLLGSTLDNVNNLSSGESWKFEAPVLEDDFSRYEIKEVSGF